MSTISLSKKTKIKNLKRICMDDSKEFSYMIPAVR